MDVSVFSVVLLTVFLGPGHGYGNHEEANRGTSYFLNKRGPRSVQTHGLKALSLLMKGAKEVPTKSPHYRKYIKQGSEEDAFKDFHSANPDRTRRSKTRLGDKAIDGYIGANILIRLTFRDRTQHDLPTILMRNHSGKLNVKIVYKNK